MFSENHEQRTALQSAQKVLADNLTDHELARLASSEEAKIRAAVAERANTPMTTIIRLAADIAPAVRAGVARNPRVDLPLEIREDLSKDKSPEVVYALIANPATPNSVLGKLARGRNRDYALAAKERLQAGGGAAARLLGALGIAAN